MINNRIGKCMLIIVRIISIVLVVFFLIKIWGGSFRFLGRTRWELIIAHIICALCLAMIFVIAKKFDGDKIFIICYLIWCVFQIFYIYSIYCAPGADIAVVENIAREYLDEVLVEGNWYFDYICRYVNNSPIVIFEIIILRIFRAVFGSGAKEYVFERLFLSAVAALFSNIAIANTIRCAVLVTKKKFVRIPTLIICILLIGFSEPAALMYTDALSLWTIPTGFGIVLSLMTQEKVERKTLIVKLVLASLVLGFGILIKPQIIIVVIAILLMGLIYFLLVNKEDKTLKKSCCILIMIGICSLLSYKLERVATDTWVYTHIAPKAYIEDCKFSFWHYLNMGLNPASNGMFNQDDVSVMWDTKGYKEKKEICISSIKERLADKGTNGTISFMINKVSKAIDDGNFSNPGIWREELYNQSDYASVIQEHCLEGHDGWNKFLGVIIQIVYLYSILLVAFREIEVFINKTRPDERSFFSDIVAIAIVGGFFFIMLFELNNRYFYVMLPLVIINDAIVISGYDDRRGIGGN